MMTRGQFSQLLAPGLSIVLFEWLKEHPEEYSKFCEVRTQDSAYDEDQIVAGFGTAVKKYEGEGVTYDDFIQGGSKRYISETYALAAQVTKEMKQDDKYGIMKKFAAELAKSMRQTVEQVGIQPLNLGFTTMTTADGETLFNTAHPLLGGGTYNNRPTTAVALSVTALQQRIINYENMVNDRGLKMRLSPDNLWIPPDLQFVAAEILQSSLDPDSANNSINTMRGRLKPHVLHYLTDTSNYFISSDEVNHIYFKWRQKPMLETADDFETGGTKVKLDARFTVGSTDWRGWDGCNP